MSSASPGSNITQMVLNNENKNSIIAEIYKSNEEPVRSVVSSFEVHKIPENTASDFQTVDAPDYMLVPFSVAGGIYPENFGRFQNLETLEIAAVDDTSTERGGTYFLDHPKNEGFVLGPEGDGKYKGHGWTAQVFDGSFGDIEQALEGSGPINAVNEILYGENVGSEEQEIGGRYEQGGDWHKIEGEVESWNLNEYVLFNGCVDDSQHEGKDIVTGLIQDGVLVMLKTPEPQTEGIESLHIGEETRDGTYEGCWQTEAGLLQLEGELNIGIGQGASRGAMSHTLAEYRD